MSTSAKRLFLHSGNEEHTNPQKKLKTFNKNINVVAQNVGHSSKLTDIPSSKVNTEEKDWKKSHVPLAEKMRPKNLTSFLGHEQVIGPNTVLRNLLEQGHVPSLILSGPPGCGKTSLAKVITCLMKDITGKQVHVINLSAATSGIGDVKNAVTKAKTESQLGKKTIIFMDEIHRFNKLQQDVFLPHIEDGTFILIGATTENPSYSLNSALLSRCRVFMLSKLTASDIINILCKAIDFLQGKFCDLNDVEISHNNTKSQFIIDKETIEWLAEAANGDARVALSGFELAHKIKVLNKVNSIIDNVPVITLKDIKEGLKNIHMLSGEKRNDSNHLYSALHISIRGGDDTAALYWLARLMAAKEDPVDIARRLVRISSEDIGLADEEALGVAVHTMHGCQMVGMPECDVFLGQCIVYLARAPKSRDIYNALSAAKKLIHNHQGPQPSVPLHIRGTGGEKNLQASLGSAKENLLRKEDNSKTYLPTGLEHVEFFGDNEGF